MGFYMILYDYIIYRYICTWLTHWLPYMALPFSGVSDRCFPADPNSAGGTCRGLVGASAAVGNRQEMGRAAGPTGKLPTGLMGMVGIRRGMMFFGKHGNLVLTTLMFAVLNWNLYSKAQYSCLIIPVKLQAVDSIETSTETES